MVLHSYTTNSMYSWVGSIQRNPFPPENIASTEKKNRFPPEVSHYQKEILVGGAVKLFNSTP